MSAARFVALWLSFLALTLAACKTAPRTRVTISKDGARIETRGEVAKPAVIEKAADGKITVTTPTTPEPIAPPTPAQTAEGWRVKAYTAAALACVLIGALLAWGKHWLAAIFAAAAAAVLHFFSTPESAWIAGICVAVAFALCAAWYIIARKRDAAPVTSSGPVTPAESQV